MSGMWVFKNGIVRLEERSPAGQPEAVRTRKVLLYTPADETMRSHEALQRRLLDLGWERYYSPDPDDPDLVQFHRGGCLDTIISLPGDFARVSSLHMYDIFIKNPEHFKVVEESGGAARLEERPAAQPRWAAGPRRKALVYVPADETMTSHEALQRRLLELGWKRCDQPNPALVQFRRRGSQDLISLPADFARLNSLHMHDIVDGNREHFKIVNTVGPVAK